MTSGYHASVPDASDFELQRAIWRRGLADDDLLREQALQLHIDADRHHFGYQWEWCGVPIIRWPDDIVLFQEVFWSLRPGAIIETGVARGGSVVLSASLAAMHGGNSAVLGMDIAIHPHTRKKIDATPFGSAITLWEGDTASTEAQRVIAEFVQAHSPDRPVLLVLDSNHTHEHVLAELTGLTPALPTGSLVMVADTIVENMPDDYYPDRPWGRGDNPATAIQQFLAQDSSFVLDPRYSRRGILTEFRDGVLCKV